MLTVWFCFPRPTSRIFSSTENRFAVKTLLGRKSINIPPQITVTPPQIRKTARQTGKVLICPMANVIRPPSYFGQLSVPLECEGSYHGTNTVAAVEASGTERLFLACIPHPNNHHKAWCDWGCELRQGSGSSWTWS